MATYPELLLAYEDPDLRKRVRVGMVDVARDVIVEDDATANHANRLRYAFHVVDALNAEAERMLLIIILDNKAATLSQITGASESVIKTNVTVFWNEFADAYVGSLP